MMYSEKKHIAGVTQADLKNSIQGLPGYRYTQILDWIYRKNVLSPVLMSNIPQTLKDSLSGSLICGFPEIIKVEKTSDDTEKFLVKLYDGECIEFVLIDSPGRKTLCISSQAGCPVQCRFCASGKNGLARNLLPGEITGQFLLASKHLGGHPDNVVFMGIGEPLLNFDNLVASLDLMCSPEYMNYAQRRITVSTSGIPRFIRRLADMKKQWNLAVSLHAPDDITRSMIIPDKARYPLAEIIDAAKYYFKMTSRLVTLEYTLIERINDSQRQAGALADIALDMNAKVNIIPYNEVPGSGFRRPAQNVCDAFTRALEKRKVNVLLRLEKGSKISAACGQLRASGNDQK